MKQSRETHYRRHDKAPDAKACIQKCCCSTARCEHRNVDRHPQQPCDRTLGSFRLRRPNHVGKIDHDLGRRAGHQRRGRCGTEMNAVGRILDRHRRHQHHAGDDRLPGIAIGERAEMDGENSAGNEENDFQAENDFQRGTISSQQRRTQEAYRDHHHAEHRKCEQFRDRAGCSQNQRGTERHEVSGDMRREQSLQSQKSRGIDKSGVQAKEQRKRDPELYGRHRLPSSGCGTDHRYTSTRQPDEIRYRARDLSALCRTKLFLGSAVTLQNELVQFIRLLSDAIRSPLFVLASGRSRGLLDKLPEVVSQNRNAIVEFRK